VKGIDACLLIVLFSRYYFDLNLSLPFCLQGPKLTFRPAQTQPNPTQPKPRQHFDLIEERELSPLQELIEQFTAGRGAQGGRMAAPDLMVTG